MHPKIEIRRKSVEIARRAKGFERDRDLVLHELMDVREALGGIEGAYIDRSTIDNFLLAIDRIVDTLDSVHVTDDESHSEICENLILSSRKFIESAKRTIAAAENI